jgi:hypothetical protein
VLQCTDFLVNLSDTVSFGFLWQREN